jgi:hypothetical protein
MVDVQSRGETSESMGPSGSSAADAEAKSNWPCTFSGFRSYCILYYCVCFKNVYNLLCFNTVNNCYSVLFHAILFSYEHLSGNKLFTTRAQCPVIHPPIRTGLVVDYDPLSLCVIHTESLCPSSGDINRLMTVMMMDVCTLSLIFCTLLSLMQPDSVLRTIVQVKYGISRASIVEKRKLLSI